MRLSLRGVTLLLFSCAGNSASSDTRTDAGAPETDAAKDVQASKGDVAADSDVGDAPLDTNSNVAWWEQTSTSWTPVSWAPAACAYAVASQPERAAPALDWQPCPDGAPGCSVFEPTTPSLTLAVYAHVARVAGAYEIGVSLFDDATAWMVYYGSSSTPKWVIRGALGGCRPIGPMPADGSIAFGFMDIESSQSKFGFISADGNPQDVDTTSLPLSQLERFTGSLLALWTTAAGAVVYDRVARKMTALTSADLAMVPVSQAPRALGSHAFVRGGLNGAYKGFVYTRPTGFSVLLDVPSKQVLDLNGDDSEVVWIQSAALAAPYQNAELWRSLLVAESGALQPTKVADLGTIEGYISSFFSSGYYAFIRDASGIEVVRVSDGQKLKVVPPTPYIADLFIYWIDEAEIFYLARKAHPRPIAIVRQRLAALGQ